MAIGEGPLCRHAPYMDGGPKGSGSQFPQWPHPASAGDVAVQLSHAQHTAQHRQCLVLLPTQPGNLSWTRMTTCKRMKQQCKMMPGGCVRQRDAWDISCTSSTVNKMFY